MKKNCQKNEYGFETNYSKSKLEKFLNLENQSRKKKVWELRRWCMHALGERNPINKREIRYL